MKTVTLNIPGLLLRLDLSETTDRLLRGVEEMFWPFVAAGTGIPDTGYAMARAPFDQHCPDTAGTGGGGGHDVRIDAGFFLKQDQRVYLEPVSPPEACALILRHHIHYFRYFPRDRVERAFHRVTGLCRQAPFFRLHFKKEPSFWPLVEKEMDKHS